MSENHRLMATSNTVWRCGCSGRQSQRLITVILLRCLVAFQKPLFHRTATAQEAWTNLTNHGRNWSTVETYSLYRCYSAYTYGINMRLASVARRNMKIRNFLSQCSANSNCRKQRYSSGGNGHSATQFLALCGARSFITTFARTVLSHLNLVLTIAICMCKIQVKLSLCLTM
jgi:hypothetical protein